MIHHDLIQRLESNLESKFDELSLMSHACDDEKEKKEED
jgi:hypothetical protein